MLGVSVKTVYNKLVGERDTKLPHDDAAEQSRPQVPAHPAHAQPYSLVRPAESP
jgi:hypothetical protein